MNPLLAYVYGALYGLAFAGAMVWITERRDKTYRQGITSFTDSFLLGVFSLLFAGGSTAAVILQLPDRAGAYTLGLTVILGVYMALKEGGYRLRARRGKRRLKDEMVILGKHSEADPSNAAYFERASELLEKLGETKNALQAARMAAKLDPTVRNNWRVKQLEEILGSGKGR